MDRSDTDQLNIQMIPVTEDNSWVNNRHIPLPACVNSGLASAVSIFCIGLVSGAAGGLLLGVTAVGVLQSLELLAENRLLMEQLEKYIMDRFFLEKMIEYVLQWESYKQVYDTQISVFAVIFGVFSSALSLPLGIFIGLSTYSLVIKIKGEAAMGKALGVAGPVCLMGVTATGYLLGLTLEGFLSITLNVSVLLWIFISGVVWLFPVIASMAFSSCKLQSWLSLIILCCFAPGAALIAFLLSFLSKMRLILVVILTPMIIVVKVLEISHAAKLPIVIVPLMLTISDVYNTVEQKIVFLQSPTSTDARSVVLEAIFVGVLTSLLFTVTVGMSIFVSWQRGGAVKICASAAGSGAAVLGAIKLALPVLGPGPTIGALIGGPGAVGVSLSAAEAVINQYGQNQYGFVGMLGVTVGAAVGAFLSSCAHSGLSGVFIGLCAATIPAEALLFSHSTSTSWRLFVCLWLCIYVVLIPFNHTALYYICIYVSQDSSSFGL
ncbi:uncharacterized protein LOC127377733 isoform X1 [Dicentrarchus labrax]|uniref:uncharacterized protein LOC127377733 isoform X1 n=2 Tax=Dicentrarchus labrax TaxID=13489 RepID=UPI0021F651F4|nr:uncharacterized protein LOC127377733 isoform X1 [Dicentrarchus labrax]